MRIGCRRKGEDREIGSLFLPKRRDGITVNTTNDTCNCASHYHSSVRIFMDISTVQANKERKP